MQGLTNVVFVMVFVLLLLLLLLAFAHVSEARLCSSALSSMP
jgi:hypothetical protein